MIYYLCTIKFNCLIYVVIFIELGNYYQIPILDISSPTCPLAVPNPDVLSSLQFLFSWVSPFSKEKWYIYDFPMAFPWAQ